MLIRGFIHEDIVECGWITMGRTIRCISDIAANILMAVMVVLFGMIILATFLGFLTRGTSTIESVSRENIRLLEQSLGILSAFISDENITVIIVAGGSRTEITHILINDTIVNTVYINKVRSVDLGRGETIVLGPMETAIIDIPYTGSSNLVHITIVYGGGTLTTIAQRVGS